jgi:hypothetical protein
MVLAISPPPMPPARGRGRPLAKRHTVLIFHPDPIRPARRAAQPCSPALAPLSAARSRAPGRHVGDMPPAFTRKDQDNGKDIEEDEDRHHDDGGSG